MTKSTWTKKARSLTSLYLLFNATCSPLPSQCSCFAYLLTRCCNADGKLSKEEIIESVKNGVVKFVDKEKVTDEIIENAIKKVDPNNNGIEFSNFAKWFMEKEIKGF